MFEGVFAATTTPFREDGSVDFDLFGKHCAWLADEGVAGLTPNGSLGEYETLTESERAQIVTVAIEAIGVGTPRPPERSAAGSRSSPGCRASRPGRPPGGPSRRPRRARPG